MILISLRNGLRSALTLSKLKKFPGGACPQTPLVGAASPLRCLWQRYSVCTPFSKYLATPLVRIQDQIIPPISCHPLVRHYSHRTSSRPPMQKIYRWPVESCHTYCYSCKEQAPHTCHGLHIMWAGRCHVTITGLGEVCPFCLGAISVQLLVKIVNITGLLFPEPRARWLFSS